MGFRILAINPGATSTKIAIFEDERPLFKKTVPTPWRTSGATPGSWTRSLTGAI